MDTIIGVLMITLSVGILVFFRPRFQSSRILSGIALAMGLMTLGTASGDMVYQLFQLAMQATVAVCCVLQIRRGQCSAPAAPRGNAAATCTGPAGRPETARNA